MSTGGTRRAQESADHVILLLEAWFPERTEHECSLVCEAATDLLVLFNDKSARTTVAKAMGIPDSRPLRSIPTDDLLATILGVPLSTLRTARHTGRLDDDVFFGRSVGRRPWDRTSLSLEWRPPENIPCSRFGPWEDARLAVSMSLADTPRGGAADHVAVVDRFFERAAKAGAYFASGRMFPLHKRSWQGGHLDTHEPPELAEAACQRMWAALGRERARYIPAVRHMMLLSPVHLERLGGRDRFIQEIKEFDRSDPAGYPPEVRATIGGSLYLWADEHILGSDGGGARFESMAVSASECGAAWLLARLSVAGLLVHQAPMVLKAMRAADAVSKRRDEGHGAAAEPDADRHTEVEAREAAFAAFMERLWASPPTFLGPHAHAVSKVAHAALTRSGRDNVTAFGVARAAGEPIGIWTPRSSRGELIAPFYIGGPTRAAALAVFDPSRHGFNGENRIGRRGSTKTPDAVHCARCGGDRFHVTAKFEYGEPEELTGDDEKSRPQDFFSWFWLDATCAACKHRVEIASVECA